MDHKEMERNCQSLIDAVKRSTRTHIRFSYLAQFSHAAMSATMILIHLNDTKIDVWAILAIVTIAVNAKEFCSLAIWRVKMRDWLKTL